MKIDKITKLANSKYKILLDDKTKIITYDDIILKNNLLYQKTLEEEDLNQIEKDTTEYDLYNKCVKMIAKKIRSEQEIKNYMEKQIGEIDLKIIKKLKEAGFINDTLFLSAYIYDRMNLSTDGPYKIRKVLLENNISEEEIEKEFKKYSSDILFKKLSHLLEKKLKSNSKYSKYFLKNKMIYYFQDLGYEKEMIGELFEKIYVSNNAVILKDYEKIKKNLERKKDCENLSFKIAQKLYQKGYSKLEIDEIMQ